MISLETRLQFLPPAREVPIADIARKLEWSVAATREKLVTLLAARPALGQLNASQNRFIRAPELSDDASSPVDWAILHQVERAVSGVESGGDPGTDAGAVNQLLQQVEHLLENYNLQELTTTFDYQALPAGTRAHLSRLVSLLTRVARTSKKKKKRDLGGAARKDRARRWMKAGVLALASRNLKAAVRLLEMATHMDPGNHEAWFYLGNAHRRVGEWKPALQAYQVAVEKQPLAEHAWINLGSLRLDLGRLDGARQALERATTLNPQSTEAWTVLARVIFVQGQTTDALALATKARELAPEWAPAWTTCAVIQQELGNTEAALTAFRQATKLAPESPRAWYDLGTALARARRQQQAIEALRVALLLVPTLVDAWVQLGLALVPLDAAKGLYCFERAIQLDPKRQNAQEWRERLQGRGLTPRPPFARDTMKKLTRNTTGCDA